MQPCPSTTEPVGYAVHPTRPLSKVPLMICSGPAARADGGSDADHEQHTEEQGNRAERSEPGHEVILSPRRRGRRGHPRPAARAGVKVFDRRVRRTPTSRASRTGWHTPGVWELGFHVLDTLVAIDEAHHRGAGRPGPQPRRPGPVGGRRLRPLHRHPLGGDGAGTCARRPASRGQSAVTETAGAPDLGLRHHRRRLNQGARRAGVLSTDLRTPLGHRRGGQFFVLVLQVGPDLRAASSSREDPRADHRRWPGRPGTAWCCCPVTNGAAGRRRRRQTPVADPSGFPWPARSPAGSPACAAGSRSRRPGGRW